MPSPRPRKMIRYFHSTVQKLSNPPGHLWRDKWTVLSGPLSVSLLLLQEREGLLESSNFGRARLPRQLLSPPFRLVWCRRPSLID